MANDRRNPPDIQPLKSAATTGKAQDAWLAYAATLRTMRDHPELARNPYYLALVDTAYARFHNTFEAL